ncbi:MAG: Gfo/Idh/MocA family protein [Pleomorphochaeta sp.]
MKTIKAIIIGGGGRGQYTYGEYAKNNPHKMCVIGIAEPDNGRREQFKNNHKISDENVYSSWKEILKKDKFADLACICTQDRMHLEPALAAIEKGYDILLEKPIAPTFEECEIIAKKAKEKGVSVAVAHVLRYTPFFVSIKNIIDSKELGNIVGIQHNENVGNIHFSHSFVRGNWRNEKLSTPMILAKSCHDMDILLYLIGANCTDIFSYGSKGYFSANNKPEDAPKRCLDGCPHSNTCPYYAPKVYLTGEKGWPTNIITTDLSDEGIIEALNKGPYGRCVFACDNDMTEHQVVSLKFENNVSVAFTMSAFTPDTSRTIKIMLDNGQIRGNMLNDEIETFNFSTGDVKTIKHTSYKNAGHGGGDIGFMDELIAHLQDKDNFELKTSIDQSLQSHKMAFAAHESMNKGYNIKL